MNATDIFLKKVIGKIFTKDEWHTIVLGFFDGLSFEKEGKWSRKALKKPGVYFENIGNFKQWYYRVPYVFGELTKLIFAVYVLGQEPV